MRTRKSLRTLRTLKTLTFALTLAGALMLAQGSPALAANPASYGALVINTEYCLPLGSQTYCIKALGVYNETVTPSGNRSYTAIYRQEVWMTSNGEILWKRETNQRLHSLTIEGLEQQMSQASRSEFSFGGQTYCLQSHVQFANGEYQFFRIEFQPCS